MEGGFVTNFRHSPPYGMLSIPRILLAHSGTKRPTRRIATRKTDIVPFGIVQRRLGFPPFVSIPVLKLRLGTTKKVPS